ncbi:hypothetical protein FVEG_10727 [Fusarium verticillioides 7600]|uniref:F-box domain-containing protein n=1 Tax=Gibberella moniliformis (strain M3125 / FGSC 7600) TaxID=334819 RepID=W7MW16_GIBM7|nr:hypothetical protein FVEG_10727 [Fusarium verticillioides 7600]EWG51865.1 hypothetical protein FVEG_10727 [Fusarium verticillioides 7600]RBQ87786.1 hypothetical protein FVER53263_10727 [Fusarium verticillioides]
MASLSSLPCEILLQIIRDSSPQELCRLSYTCKRLASIAGECLWTDIELHEKGYHESSAELNEPLPYKSPNRFYHDSERDGWQSDISERAKSLFTMLLTLHAHDEGHLREVAGRVKSLCTVIEPEWKPDEGSVAEPVSVWKLLPYFKNLQYLELHGAYGTFDHRELEGTREQRLAKLRFAKLFAYIPRSVATYVLQSQDSLDHLELGMLDQPLPNTIAITEQDTENHSQREHQSRGVIPRPLGHFLSDGRVHFPNLKHLYLCSPCYGRGDYFNQHNAWSTTAERDTLEAWKRLTLASSRTLETLVIEHRPAAGIEDNEGFSEDEFLSTGKTGAANKALVDAIGDIIIDKEKLSRLKRVYLYGFVAGRSYETSSVRTPGDWLVHGLGAKQVTCEARRGRWCLFDQDSGETKWAKWTGDGNSNLHDGYMGIRWYSLLARV